MDAYLFSRTFGGPASGAPPAHQDSARTALATFENLATVLLAHAVCDARMRFRDEGEVLRYLGLPGLFEATAASPFARLVFERLRELSRV